VCTCLKLHKFNYNARKGKYKIQKIKPEIIVTLRMFLESMGTRMNIRRHGNFTAQYALWYIWIVNKIMRVAIKENKFKNSKKMFYINSLSIFNLSRSLLCEILTEKKANASNSTNCGWLTEPPHVLFTCCCFSTVLPNKITQNHSFLWHRFAGPTFTFGQGFSFHYCSSRRGALSMTDFLWKQTAAILQLN